MLDLSEEYDNENIATCVKYFKRMAKINQWLEMEIGITGGEEDGVNNENVDNEKLYTSPEQVQKPRCLRLSIYGRETIAYISCRFYKSCLPLNFRYGEYMKS